MDFNMGSESAIDEIPIKKGKSNFQVPEYD
jgi:hypothetical protein